LAEAVLIVRLVSVSLFAIMAINSLIRHRQLHDRPSRWFGITFAELSIVGIGLIALPQDADGAVTRWLVKLTSAGFLLFPYLLYRFTAAFIPASRRSEAVAGGLTALVTMWVLAMPKVLGPTDPKPAWYALLAVLAILLWTGLTLTAAMRLWRAGTGRPTVIRRRLRTLALGSVGMSTILVAATATPRSGSASDLAFQSLALLCAVAFFTGFAPPRILRHAWRQPEEDAVRTAEAALMAATTEDEVASGCLPHLAAIIGAGGAALYARDGRLIGRHGPDPALPGFEAPSGATSGSLRADLITLEFPFGWLVVSAGPHAPFFGQEELSLARALGALASLALERCEAFRRERDMRQQLTEAQTVARLGSWEWDVTSGAVRWSDELYRIYGLEPGGMETTEQGILHRIHPDDQQQVQEVILGACRDLEPFVFDHRIVLPDGAVRHVHGRGKVLAGPSGEVLRLVGTAQDVTEQRDAEEKLRASETMFRSMLASAPDALIGVEPDGKIVLANERTERLFGYSSAELLGQPVEILLSEGLRKAHVRHRESYVRDPATRPMGAGLELTALRKDGSEFPVDVSLSAVETGGGRLVTAFIRDVSGRREAEENVRRLQAAAARQRQAIELNDDIFQGLTVARYALDLGQTGVASRAVDETLGSARAIVSDLLREEESQAGVGPGDLVRRTPLRLGPTGGPGNGETPDGLRPQGLAR
jgi:PAS domain S-box-containing protein